MDTKQFLASELLITLAGGGYHWGKILSTEIPGGFVFKLTALAEGEDITYIPFQYIKSLTVMKEKK